MRANVGDILGEYKLGHINYDFYSSIIRKSRGKIPRNMSFNLPAVIPMQSIHSIPRKKFCQYILLFKPLKTDREPKGIPKRTALWNPNPNRKEIRRKNTN